MCHIQHCFLPHILLSSFQNADMKNHLQLHIVETCWSAQGAEGIPDVKETLLDTLLQSLAESIIPSLTRIYGSTALTRNQVCSGNTFVLISMPYSLKAVHLY